MSGMNKLRLFGFLAAGCASVAFAEPVVKYSQVDVDLSGFSIQDLASLGVTVDHHGGAINGALRLELSEYEVQILRDNRIRFRTLIDDFSKYIQDRNIL